ncbi:MAG: hypothetical protein V3S69_01370 [Dehalococcoidales bacterium]
MANDPLGREPGEALWPERFSRERLLKIKEALGNYWWQAMYQQNPLASMAGANLGDMLKVILKSDVPNDRDCKRVRAWDVAATAGGGDWTAGPLLGNHRAMGKIIIEDMQRFQKSSLNTELMVTTCAEGDGHGVQVMMEQEPGSSGLTVIDHYTKLLPGYVFKGEKATGPIEVRAGPFLAAVEAGRVLMVKADWNEELILEMNAFPDGEHDDQVIALALAYNKLIKGLYGGVTWGRNSADVSNVIPIRGGKNQKPLKRDRMVTGLTWR